MANERARALRKRMSDGERRLWRALRTRQMDGMPFRRQHPIGNYIADFVCLEKRLSVEVDGGHHTADAQMARDARRDLWLGTEGYRVLRVPGIEVFRNLSGVLDTIWAELQALPSAARHCHAQHGTSPHIARVASLARASSFSRGRDRWRALSPSVTGPDVDR